MTHTLNRQKSLELLSGSGIEIGALHRPVEAPHLRITYVDRLTRAQALEHYPELLPYEAAIVEPDILDDAETLQSIPVATQDFVVANHVIEHMRDPIGSLLNWLRVLRKGGRLFLAVPNHRATFDQERELTPLEHLRLDHSSPSEKRDYEHFKDFALQVSCRFFKVKPESEAEAFAEELWNKRDSIHYHVWNFSTFKDFLHLVREEYAREAPFKEISSLDAHEGAPDEFLFVVERV